MYSYIGGILTNNKSRLIAANSTTNHIHLLVSLSKTIALSEIIGDVKRDSSKWLKTQGAKFGDFHWQDGYGAFSIGQSQVQAVKRYIMAQKDRHSALSFEDEFRSFLRKYEIEYNERYVWD